MAGIRPTETGATERRSVRDRGNYGGSVYTGNAAQNHREDEEVTWLSSQSPPISQFCLPLAISIEKK